MIQSPKPAKPVLHLLELEANRFNQLQTRYWRPRDQSIHSGSPSSDSEESDKSVSCTRNHRIRGILINHNFPYWDAFTLGAITHQRPSHQSYTVFESLPACLGAPICTWPHWIRRIPIRPEERPGLLTLAKPILFKECLLLLQFGSTQTYLCKPGHHINHPEDIQEVLSFNSTQEIRRISLYINIPYMATFTLNAFEEFLQYFRKAWRSWTRTEAIKIQVFTSFSFGRKQFKPNGYIPWSHQSLCFQDFKFELFCFLLSFYDC